MNRASRLRWPPTFRKRYTEQIGRISQLTCFPHGLGSLRPMRHRTGFFESG